MHQRATSATIQASSIRITAAITRTLRGTCTVVLAVIVQQRHRAAFWARGCKLLDAIYPGLLQGKEGRITANTAELLQCTGRPFELTSQAGISRPIHQTNTRRTSRDRALGAHLRMPPQIYRSQPPAPVLPREHIGRLGHPCLQAHH